MNYCIKCRKPIKGREKFCGPCGTEIINQNKKMADEIKETEVPEEGEEITIPEVVVPEVIETEELGVE